MAKYPDPNIVKKHAPGHPCTFECVPLQYRELGIARIPSTPKMSYVCVKCVEKINKKKQFTSESFKLAKGQENLNGSKYR